MEVLTKVRPFYLEGVDSFQTALESRDKWNGKMLGVRCPSCKEIFYIFAEQREDDFGVYDRVWGFCSHCNHRFEACL